MMIYEHDGFDFIGAITFALFGDHQRDPQLYLPSWKMLVVVHKENRRAVAVRKCTTSSGKQKF